ncbi:MAG: polyribonucleotide nucleotidyltransferase [Coriobacteriales bacterium]|jgi:polyribonucleotide nucleotidyltransferase|nr:polyribonucleotide nucleotidyltransferase [Coriobacteriales bacterium]
MKKISKSFTLYGKEYCITTGEIAKQATGAVVISQGDTIVLVTAVVSKERRDYDFFPLTVDVVERMYAVGRIPGGYIKRESRPSDKGTLMARMIDRPIRPGFPEGFRNEVQIVATILSADQVHQPDVIAITAASTALMLGGVPFDGPAAGVRIARNTATGEFIVNPTFEEEAESDLELTVAGTADYISMVEAGANEVSEEDMLAALNCAQEAIAKFCDIQQEFLDSLEPDMRPEIQEYPLDEENPEVANRVLAYYDAMSIALKDADKTARTEKVSELKEQIKASFSEEELQLWGKEIPAQLKALEKKAMRDMVISTGERVDGRRTDEIRPITADVSWLPRAHGSGLFTRGQTQVLSVLTLGMLNEWQRLDTIDPCPGKRYFHQYSFPPYCTGETGRMGAPKRREIGHGALAERALVPVLPPEDEFPYTIRIVSEVMESNGSSSMASACGSTLALMDAGVPIKRPVSGIAMGLIKEGDDVAILSDIQGIEDFLGDMDFKVCGTERGITALQMDNKARGLSVDILARALNQAKAGRAHILSKMFEAIQEPRPDLSDFAPRIISMKIPVDKIRDVIGSGGKVIRGLQEETGATIEITEDGTVYIASKDTGGEEARRRIETIIKVPEIGEEYHGTVVSIQSFGAFVELLPGKDGLLHISRVANGRVASVEDVLAVGDTVHVKIIDIDEKDKISLDRLDKPEAPAASFTGGGRDSRNRDGQGRSSFGGHDGRDRERSNGRDNDNDRRPRRKH